MTDIDRAALLPDDLAAIVQRVRRRIGGNSVDHRKDCLALCAAVEQLQGEKDDARKRLLTAAGDDLCRLSQEEIKAMSIGEVPIPPKEEFLASCEQFHAQVSNTNGVNQNCLTLAQLVAENERLRADQDAARQVARKLLGLCYRCDGPPSRKTPTPCPKCGPIRAANPWLEEK